MRRRGFVALVGSVGVGGCLRSQTGTDTGQSPTDGQRTVETRAKTSTPTATESDRATTEEPATETETDTGVTFSEQWSLPGSEFAIADGVVYNYGDRLGAWRTDGERVWERAHPDGRTQSGPAADDGAVYLGYRNEDGTSSLRAFDGADGSQLWAAEIDGKVRSDPLPAGEAVLVNVRDWGDGDADAILGFDRASGERRWAQESGTVTVAGSTRLGTVDGDGFAYVTAGTTFDSARVSKLDPATGERRWDWTQPTPASEPVYADGSVYLGTYDSVVALTGDSGEQRWNVETFDQNPAPPVVDGDVVYAGSRDTGVYAIGVESGERHWRYQTDGAVERVAVGDGRVYAATGEDTVFAIDDGGTLAGQVEFDGRISKVAYADGSLFVGSSGTTAYQVSES